MAMTLVSNTTLGTNTTVINIQNIPQNAKDLLLVMSIRSDDASMNIRFNNTSDNYAWRILSGNGSTATSTNASAQSNLSSIAVSTTSNTANTFGSIALYISNYTAAATKSFSVDAVTENNATAATQQIIAGSWANNTAISSIYIYADTYQTNSSFTLYTIS